ncbi:hypothetical protein CEXT_437361 [Caerostris extrusa]|uniref:Uncharacterized protein n=1 Tax=Caerostris extrusa TaxID=172846 RepID=A0AAV4XQ74_CAEEX|nr:hypothetical protein CEXT_437361 [Caerostris extrusa]
MYFCLFTAAPVDDDNLQSYGVSLSLSMDISTLPKKALNAIMNLLRIRRVLHTLWPCQNLADPTSHQHSRMQCLVIAQTPANLSQTVLKVVELGLPINSARSVN